MEKKKVRGNVFVSDLVKSGNIALRTALVLQYFNGKKSIVCIKASFLKQTRLNQ